MMSQVLRAAILVDFTSQNATRVQDARVFHANELTATRYLEKLGDIGKQPPPEGVRTLTGKGI